MRRKKYLLCVIVGILFFIAAEAADNQSRSVEKGILFRYPCGKGDAEYEFYVEGLGEKREKISLTVPEQQMTKEQFEESIPEIKEELNKRILGDNPSLLEVRTDLELLTELEGYGISISWNSEAPEIISRLGTVYGDEVSKDGHNVILRAELSCGNIEEVIELPVTVYPQTDTKEERFRNILERNVRRNRREREILLPAEFEDKTLSYRSASHGQNMVLLFLGVIGAICLWLKEKSDQREQKKQREENLLFVYQELVSGFLILMGAGYPTKAAWKKLTKDLEMNTKEPMQILVREMQIAVNQMETGTPEAQAYAAFGRRCGVRCYIRFASLLESNLNTGGKNLRNLLEAEMDEAFKQRTDLAKRRGEEASSKLLLPMFGMLGVVMVMVIAPAFLSIS